VSEQLAFIARTGLFFPFSFVSTPSSDAAGSLTGHGARLPPSLFFFLLFFSRAMETAEHLDLHERSQIPWSFLFFMGRRRFAFPWPSFPSLSFFRIAGDGDKPAPAGLFFFSPSRQGIEEKKTVLDQNRAPPDDPSFLFFFFLGKTLGREPADRQNVTLRLFLPFFFF